jgi:glycosyltransferase involved in cell wall biosynthesis
MRTSICIPTYNGARYIEETLWSIGQQTLPVFETVLSDDGSTDDTVVRASAIAHEAGLNVRIVHNAQRGPTQNYLNAVSFTTGDIVMLADQDDPIDPRRNAVVTAAFEQDPDLMLVSSDSEIVGFDLAPTGRTLRGGPAASTQLCRSLAPDRCFRAFLRGGLPFLAHTLAFRAKVRPLVLDWPAHVSSFWMEEWVTAICACAGRIAAVPDALTRYRQHETQFASLTGKDRGGQGMTTDAALASRVAKLRYLMSLLRSDEVLLAIAGPGASKKSEEMQRYVDFAEARLRLRSGARGTQMPPRRLMSLMHNYFRYARGGLSVGSDLLQCLRSRADGP